VQSVCCKILLQKNVGLSEPEKMCEQDIPSELLGLALRVSSCHLAAPSAEGIEPAVAAPGTGMPARALQRGRRCGPPGNWDSGKRSERPSYFLALCAAPSESLGSVRQRSEAKRFKTGNALHLRASGFFTVCCRV
jgi:hypothetical protein